uniref:Protein sleepless n=1 Tax=Arion vulgaris TaxID=1028688 RepID=A0A0B6XZQ2_9EUPU
MIYNIINILVQNKLDIVEAIHEFGVFTKLSKDFFNRTMNVAHVLNFLVFMIVICRSEALNCSNCNVRYMGTQNLCKDPRNATGCIGCMKTVAKVKLRDSGYIDGWERLSEVVSRVCITAGNINIKPAGCYKQQNNGGYTEMCFCYTDNCNSKAHRSAFDPIATVFITVATFTLTNLVMYVHT